MKNKLTIAVAALTLAGMALVLSQCSEEAEKTLLLTDAAAAFSTDICTRAYDCCTTQEMDDLRGTSWTDEASCITYFTGIFTQTMVNPVQAAIAAGRGQYDAGIAGECEATFAARGCVGAPQNDMTALAEDCTGMYVGLQGIDEPCINNFECAPGSMCVGAAAPAEGTCQAFLALNAACTPGGQPYCAAGLYCDGQSCVERKPLNADCASSSECATGLECDANSKCVEVVNTTCDGQ